MLCVRGRGKGSLFYHNSVKYSYRSNIAIKFCQKYKPSYKYIAYIFAYYKYYSNVIIYIY